MEKKQETLEERLATYAAEAAKMLDEDPELEIDPTKVEQMAESVATLLSSPKSGIRPEVKVVPRTQNVPWLGLIDAGKDCLVEEMGSPNAQVARGGDGGDRARAEQVNEEGRTVCLKLSQAIEGTGARSKLSAELREKIIAGRPFPHSRPAMITHIRLSKAAIEGRLANGLEVPDAVEAMVPVLDAMLNTLRAAPVLTPGKAKTGKEWTRSVKQVALQLQLMLSDLLAWSAAKNDPKPHQALNRIVMGRRRAKDSGDAGETPATGSDDSSDKKDGKDPKKPD